MILDVENPTKFMQKAMSRNRSTTGRRNRFFIDIYISRGQVIARMWPTKQLYDRSPQYQKTIDAVIREREIEKFLFLGDVTALKLRATKSRYNWWEVLGKIYISHEYHFPGKSVGIRHVSTTKTEAAWHVKFVTDRYCLLKIDLFSKTGPNYFKGHSWYYVTHREAGYENTLRGNEALNPCFSYFETQPDNEKVNHEFIFGPTLAKEYDAFIVTAYGYTDANKRGQTGIYLLTIDDPWWLNAPLGS